MKYGAMIVGRPVEAGANALVNGDLFGFAIYWFRDVDLQQAVFELSLDVFDLYIHRQGKTPFEFSEGSFPPIIIVFLDLVVRGPFSLMKTGPTSRKKHRTA
jgi:hypothetical protein